MADSDSASGGFAFPQAGSLLERLVPIALIALFGTGLLVKPERPRTARPPEALPSRAIEHTDKVDLRLWQDPFAAVEEDWRLDRELESKSADRRVHARREAHDRELFKNAVGSVLSTFPADCVLVLPIAVPSSWYQRDREERRRARFAVCAALEASCYVPVDASHIRYVTFDPDAAIADKTPDAAARSGNAQDAARTNAQGGSQDPHDLDRASVLLPYEIFRREGSKDGSGSHVFVVWVRDGDLVGSGLKSTLMSRFREWLLAPSPDLVAAMPNREERLRFLVLGPRSSDTLERLRDDGALGPVEFGVASDVYWIAATPTKKYDEKRVGLEQSSPTDDALVEKLAGELERRRVDLAEDPIALLCEYDSAYTRALHRLFSHRMTAGHAASDAGSKPRTEPQSAGAEQQPQCGSEATDPSNLWSYFFLRGLEGEQRQDPSSGTASAEESQVDYVTALARKIRERSGADEPRAIGIFGIDIFDKLLLLRILRPLFPRALFFTVELDTLYLDPEEIPTTRNLIVVSGFGFSVPTNEKQDDCYPPMRGSAQTSIGHAANLILKSFATAPSSDWELFDTAKESPDGALALAPRAFEIGARTEVDLDLRVEPPDGSVAWPVFGAVLLLALLAGFVAQGASWFATPQANAKPPTVPSEALRIVSRYAVPFASVTAIVVALAWWDGTSGTGEPFAFWNGISSWPTIGIYAWSTLLAVAFLRWTTGGAKESRDAVAKLAERPANVEKPSAKPEVGSVLHVVAGLRDQLQRNGLQVFVLLLMYLALVGLFFACWGAPSKPTRGPLNHWSYCAAIAAAVITLDLLLVYVLVVSGKAAQACKRMRVRLNSLSGSKATTEPDRSFAEVHAAVDATGILASRLERTVWRPLLPLALMVFARSSGFDRYDWPISLNLAFALAAALTLANAHAFHRAIADCRRAAKNQVDRWLEENHPDTASTPAEDYRELQKRLERERSGPLGWMSVPALFGLVLSLGSIWALRAMDALKANL